MIVLKHVAKLPTGLTKAELLPILEMYSYTNNSGQNVNNWYYKDKICYLPPNIEKLTKVAQILGCEIDDQRSLGKPLDEPFVLNPNFKLREYQKEPAKEFIDYLKDNFYGMLEGETGSGKTSTTTYVCGHFNCKILILCDMSSLLQQWQAAFNGVWNKDVQILKSGDTKFSDCCATTFQLLNKNKELLKLVKKEFGVTIIDEVHISSANCWKDVLLSIDSKYRAGISATIYRKGFSNEILTDLIGPIAVSMKDEQKVIPKIVLANSGVKWYSESPDDFSRTLSKLASDETRNLFILGLVKKYIKEGRKVALIGPTIEMLKGICEDSKSFSNPRMFVGSTTLEQDLALKDDLDNGKINLILTARKISKGIDLPALDCIIMATPSNSKAAVIQLVGRVLRKHKDKPQPIVVDIVDDSSLAKCFARNRKKWYIESKFEMD